MIRKFDHGILVLRNNFYVANLCVKSRLDKKGHYKVSWVNVDNEIFKEHNPLLGPMVMSDWKHQ